jgi:catechol 2,3-dioxygenase-like lactoylglutathione lyase family enzyme
MFTLNAIVAQLPSTDLTRTSQFYQQLGFRETSRHPGFLSLALGPHELHFWLTDDVHLCQNSSCYLRITGIRAFYQQLPPSALHPRGELRACPWGMTECYLLDPDGNLLKCGEPTAEASPATADASNTPLPSPDMPG